jgi:diacylglycerol diphosphate phosphatase/phosphatidate phosphatase
LARCSPDPSVVGEIKCTGPPSIVLEGRRSFPSGHASSTFGGMVFAALFLAGQIKLLDGYAYLHKFFICIAPVFAAVLVGLSRIVDYRHHWSDGNLMIAKITVANNALVLAGALIGSISAVTAYFYYFPGLTSKECNMPRGARLDDLEQVPLNQPDNTV